MALRFFEYKGITKSMSQWARAYGMHFATLKRRIDKQGLSIEQALNKPIRGNETTILHEDEFIDDEQQEDYLKCLRFRCYRALKIAFQEKIPYYFSLPDPCSTEDTFTWKIRNPSMKAA